MQQIKQFFFHPDYTVGRGVAPHRPGGPGSRTIPPVKNCGENAAHFALKNWENGWFFSILDLVVAIVYASKENLSREVPNVSPAQGRKTVFSFFTHSLLKFYLVGIAEARYFLYTEGRKKIPAAKKQK